MYLAKQCSVASSSVATKRFLLVIDPELWMAQDVPASSKLSLCIICD